MFRNILYLNTTTNLLCAEGCDNGRTVYVVLRRVRDGAYRVIDATRVLPVALRWCGYVGR